MVTIFWKILIEKLYKKTKNKILLDLVESLKHAIKSIFMCILKLNLYGKWTENDE